MIKKTKLWRFLICQILFLSVSSFSLLSAQTGPNDDFDGDGVINSLDLDDDNDGVPDAVESPACYYTASEWNTLAKPAVNGVTVSSALTTTTGNFSQLLDGVNNVTAVTFSASPVQPIQNANVYLFTFAKAVKLNALYLKFNTATQFGGTTKIQGSNTNNGSDWVDLSAAVGAAAGTNVTVNGAVSVTTSIKYPVTLNTATSYKYIRITGVAASNIAAQNASEVYFDFDTAEYVASFYPKASCTDTNLDGDGILSQFDLDTDGDGCSDSVEAGNTPYTSNNTTTFNTGIDANNNGLLDQFESTTIPGTINYTSTYNLYATSATLSVCRDTDGDGITDLNDIDDDNDGILDIYEQQLFACDNTFGTENKLINWTLQNSNTATGTLTLNGETVNVVATTTKTFAGLRDENWGFGSGAYTGCPGSGDVAPNSAINIFSNDYTVTYTFSRPVKNPALSFSSYNGIGVTFSQPVYVSGIQGTVPTLSIGNYITSFPGTENTVSVIYHGVYNSISFTLTGADNQGATMLFIPSIEPVGTATYVNTTGSPFGYGNLDTDGDGIFNHLDLDSDGDGCPDAQESGVTGTLLNGDIVNSSGTVNVANAIAQGPYGNNGLANSLENNDTASATTSFSSTYNNYALYKNINLCIDTDNDGINDLLDIDDDNDGVVDAVESPSCFYTQVEAGVIVSVKSSLTSPDDDQLDGDIQILHDGAAALNFNYTAGQPINGASLLIVKYPTAIQISQLSLVNATTFGTGVTARLEGSNDGISWTNLGNGDVVLDNTVNPKVFNNTNIGKYQYYRILGTAGGNTIATTTIGEVNFVLAPFIASLHPKPTCTVDTDGDGILNHLDLDSDGDGCSDAYEGGATVNKTPNFVFTSAVGTNGLADVLETSADSGNINYNSTYNPYATSAFLNACVDTDNDGISDLTDIDDDNDGVLDATESPACYYTSDEAGILAKISTGLGNSTVNSIAVNPGDDIPTMRDGTSTSVAASNHVVPAAQTTTTNAVIYKLEYPTAVNLASVNVIGLTANWGIGSFAVLEASNDDVTYTAVSAPLATSAGTTKTWTVTAPGITNFYKYYRIRVSTVGSTTPTFTNYEMTATVGSANYIPSAHPKAICADANIDGDGIPPYRDLDSDGDGCSDGVEAGNTIFTSNNTTTFNTGTDTNNNGLLDQFESSTTPGTVNYNSTYPFFAVNSAISACLDSDGDTVPDIVDIDDDNDGVLDVVETNCPPATGSPTISAVNGTVIDNNEFSYWESAQQVIIDYPYSFQNFNTLFYSVDTGDNFTVTVKLDDGTIVGPLDGRMFSSTSDPSWVNRWTTKGYPIASSNVNWNSPLAELTGSPFNPGDIFYTSSYPNNLQKSWGAVEFTVPQTSFVNGIDQIIITIKDGVGATAFVEIEPLNIISSCADIDTDNDSIPNRLDLDSDGDGCPDAVEAGVSINAGASGSMSASGGSIYTGGIPSGTANAYVGNGTPSQYGANGYFNSIETSSESGIYNGTLTYSQYALANNLSVCADTDGDGINDIVDIDDDNDGVLDAVESPACFYTAAEIGVPQSVTTQIANTGVIANVYDNNVATTFAFTNGSTKVNLTVFDITPLSAVKAVNVFVRYSTATANALGTTANSVTVDGWNGTSWVTLQTYTPAAAVANVQTFAIPAGSQATYTKYRLQGLLTTVTNAVITEVGLTAASDYNPSAHPKSTCGADFDGDGIFNHLDSDSDNDGCSDAFEAGTVAYASANGGTFSAGTLNNPSSTLSPNATVGNNTPADYGANGFYNILETSENGVYLGTYTYANAINALIANCTAACYKPAITAGTVLDTKQGITSLKRAGSDNDNWPMVRKGAWTALESKTKGFVPNRLTITQINAIPAANLREGMMVYNISSDCLYINTDGTATGWKCFNTQACP